MVRARNSISVVDELGRKTIRADHEAFARYRREHPRVWNRRRVGPEGAGDDVATTVVTGLRTCDLPGSDHLFRLGMVDSQLPELTLEKAVHA